MNDQFKPKDILLMWEDAFSAVMGAYNTPIARRKLDNEYSQDAMARMREFNDAIVTSLKASVLSESSPKNDAVDAQRYRFIRSQASRSGYGAVHWSLRSLYNPTMFWGTEAFDKSVDMASGRITVNNT